MGIRKKFFALAGLVGVILAVVSGIGYYTAYTNLQQSVNKELLAVLDAQSQTLDGWLSQKSRSAVSAANLMTEISGRSDLAGMKEMLSMAADDKDVLSLATGDETGAIMSYADGNLTGKIDPRQRPWYIAVKQSGKIFYTDAYQDTLTKKIVVSVAVPYKGKDGAFHGAICEDISLDTLKKQVADVKYRKEGKGIIIEKTGKILASAADGDAFTDVSSNALLKDHFQDMVKDGQGFFMVKDQGESDVFAYTTVPSTGWIIGIAVPESFVFAQVFHLKLVYGILTVLGLILIVFACLKFSNRIVQSILQLRAHAEELAKGNLRLHELTVESTDELGILTRAFNLMSQNIRELIKKMAATSEQVAASSEELTASAQQSAEASNHVAGTVSEVADGMEEQMQSLDGAKRDVDRVSQDMNQVAKKTRLIAETSVQTAEAAQKGGELMHDAMGKMENIESSVLDSAEVVKTLGENSQQIGQIVDTIAAIADQTNLLALNAAIEAARAGEHGRGFAVVAEEVRKLAAESQSSAEQIKERIASIRQDTERAVEAMQGGTDEVKRGTAAIREVGTQFSEILQMVTSIKEQMEDIDGSVQTVSAGAGRIVGAVDSIDQVSRRTSEHTQTISAATEEQSASTEEIASASQALAQMAMELQEAAGKFQV